MLRKKFRMLLKIIVLLFLSCGAFIHSDDEIQATENDNANSQDEKSSEVGNTHPDGFDTHFTQIPNFQREISDKTDSTIDVDYSSSRAEKDATIPDIELLQDKPVSEVGSVEVTKTVPINSPEMVGQSDSSEIASMGLMEQATRHVQSAPKEHVITDQLLDFGPFTPVITDGTNPLNDPLKPAETVITILPDDVKPVDDTSVPGDGVSGDQKDDIETLKREREMPSFDEWKKMKMLEMHSEKVKHVDAPVQSPQNGRKNSFHKTNYASSTCGAKVLVANHEAQSASFILTENRDQYMINPCSAKKWFIVELCEPVQIHTIELGNLELFSSTPEKFVVSISERYPSKEWRVAGALNARDERSVQNFPLHTDAIYVKYIKVEMVSHYGREHYCPLTILRVFGTAVEDDDPDDDVLSPALTGTDDDGLDLTAGSDADTRSTTLLTAATDTIRSIVKSVLTSAVSSQQSAEQKTSADDKVLSSASETVSSSSRPRQDSEASNKPTTRLKMAWTVPAAPSKNSVWAYVAKHCNYCDTNPLPGGCWFGLGTVCGYVRVMHFMYPTSCIRPVSNDSSTSVQQRDTHISRDDILYVSPDGYVGGSHELVNGGTTTGVKQSLPDSKAGIPTSGEVKVAVDVANERVTRGEFNAAKNANEKQTADNKTIVTGEQGVSVEDASDKASFKSQNDIVISDMLMETSADDMETEAGAMYQSNNGGSGGGEDEGEQFVAKLNAGKKETIYMKLRNRIKAMELNLSLSSRYLEELSQRYRRQMDDMYVSLNKTITKLANTSKSAERRDEKQQEQLNMLQQALDDLALQMATVMQDADNSYFLMLEQHLLVFCLQAIFFMLLVAWMRKTQNHAHKMLLDALAQRSASASVGVTSSCCHATCQGDRQLPPRDDHEPPAAATSAVSPTSGDGEHNMMKDNIIARNLSVFLWDSSSVCLPPTDASILALSKKKKKKRKNRQSLDAALNKSVSSVSLPMHQRYFSEPPSPVAVSRSDGDTSTVGSRALFTCGAPTASSSRASSPCSSIVSSLSDVSLAADLDPSCAVNRAFTNGRVMGDKSRVSGDKLRLAHATINGTSPPAMNGSSTSMHHSEIETCGWLEHDLRNGDALLGNNFRKQQPREPAESTPKRLSDVGAKKFLNRFYSLSASPLDGTRGGDRINSVLSAQCNGSANVCNQIKSNFNSKDHQTAALRTAGSTELT